MNGTHSKTAAFLAAAVTVAAIAQFGFYKIDPTSDSAAIPQAANESHRNGTAGHLTVIEAIDEREAHPDEVELKEPVGQPTVLPRAAVTPIGPALQSDLELLGPDSDFDEAVRDFANELRDDDWAIATESRIWRAISAVNGLTAAEVQVQCKTTTCRIRMDNARFDLNAKYPNFGDFVWDLGLEVTWHWGGPDGLGNRADFAYLHRGEAEKLRSETAE